MHLIIQVLLQHMNSLVQKRLEFYVKELQKQIALIEDNEVYQKAEKLYVTEYLAKQSGNPNIKNNIISLYEGFHKVHWLDKYFNDLQDQGNPIIQIITSTVMADIRAKELYSKDVAINFEKTANELIKKAMGGILIIDEAYMLGDKQNSYNDDAIGTLIAAMENNRDNLVCIFAGYTKEMQSFMNANSGIASRIGYTLEFDDYTTDELVAIFDGMVKKAGFEVTEDAHQELRRIIEENRHQENFGNARFVRNVFEKSIIKHASNTKNVKSKKILRTISAKDISAENLIN